MPKLHIWLDHRRWRDLDEAQRERATVDHRPCAVCASADFNEHGTRICRGVQVGLLGDIDDCTHQGVER